MPMPSASLFIIISAPYATSVPLCLTYDIAKMIVCMLSLALASTTLTLFYLKPLRKTSSNSRKNRTSWSVSLLSSSILQSTYSTPAAPLAPH